MNIVNKLYNSFNQFSGRIAIKEDEKCISYQDLFIQSSKISSFLKEQGITNSCIAIDIEDATDHIIAILGVLMSENHYVSITPENRAFFNVADELTVRLAISSSLMEEMLKQPGSNGDPGKEVTIDPNSEMCAFFTSGSTGKPKIVVHTHKNIYTDTLRQIEENLIRPEDKIDLMFSLGFSASLACIYPALLTGAQLTVFNLKEKGLNGLAVFWERQEITFTSLSVSAFQGVCKIQQSFKHLDKLRFISIGAEPVKDTTVALFKSRFSEQVVLQIAYAATETRTISEIKIYNDGRTQSHIESMGRPVKGKKVRIANAQGKNQREGVVGEIVIESEYIADAYLGQHEENIKTFSKKENIIRYRTGDLGYLNPQGYLFYTGRSEVDNKISGIKINFNTVEQEIERIPEILQAVVVINILSFEHPKLVCYYRQSTPNKLTGSDIRQTIENCLPGTHLPHLYIDYEQIPYTHSGKIDRKRLGNMHIAESNLQKQQSLEIQDNITHEDKIIAVFKAVLETDEITAISNFFNCGGDSLTSLLCIAEIEKRLGISLSSFVLVENPTPKQLSSMVLGQVSIKKSFVKIVEINGRVMEKRNLYFLNYISDPTYNLFVNESLSAEFNLIHLYYDLFNCRTEGAAQAMITEIAGLMENDRHAIVMGNSFNGYIAHQLACQMPQIDYCILIDTYNYFEFEMYRHNGFPGWAFADLFWQIIRNKDYKYPVYLFLTLQKWLKAPKPGKNRAFVNGINNILDNIDHKMAGSNCIYFQATREYKHKGKSWKRYFKGNFHFKSFIATHRNIIVKNSTEMSDYVLQITCM